MISRDQKPSAFGVGLYGKIPTQGDYVMANLIDPVGMALTEWIDRSYEDLVAAKFTFPPFLIRFVFTAPTLSGAAVGVIGPSQDRIGRHFPIAIFHTLSIDSVLNGLAAVAISYAEFSGQVSALIGEIPSLEEHDLFERYRALRPPSQEQIAQARQDAQQALEEADAQDFACRLFGDLNQGRHNYAYYTFMVAALRAAKDPTNASPTVLECPVMVDIDLLAWLDLAQRTLGWREQVPSAFWAVEPKPRFLISLGAAPKLITRCLSDPDYASSKLWPLWTDRSEAIDEATAELAEVTGSAQSCPKRSIKELFTALRQHRYV